MLGAPELLSSFLTQSSHPCEPEPEDCCPSLGLGTRCLAVLWRPAGTYFSTLFYDISLYGVHKQVRTGSVRLCQHAPEPDTAFRRPRLPAARGHLISALLTLREQR